MSSSSDKPLPWCTWTNLVILVMALWLATPRLQVPVPLEHLTPNDQIISTELPSIPFARTMEQVQHWWQEARPAYIVWHSALLDTLHDSSKAAHSWSRLCYWTALPLLRLLYYFITTIVLQSILYDMVLVQGLHWSPHVWRQLRKAANALWHWQWSRTPPQVLLEVVLLMLCGLLYQLHRRGYFSRFHRAVARRGRQLQQAYESGIGSIVRGSQFLAIMTPYILYLWCILFLQLLMPRVLYYIIVELNTVSILSRWYPILYTIYALFQQEHAAEDGAAATVTPVKNEDPSETPPPSKKPRVVSSKKSKKSTAVDDTASAPRSVTADAAKSKEAKNHRHSPVDIIPDRCVMLDCLYYWIISNMMICLHRALVAIPILGSWVFASSRATAVVYHIQFYVYLSLYLIPYILTPTTIQKLDRYRDLHDIYIEDFVAPLVQTFHHNISSVISETTYQAYILEPTERVLQLLQYTGMLSPSLHATLYHLLHEGRSVLVPTLLLFSPVIGSSTFCILYVAYVLPVAQQCATAPHATAALRTTSQWLRFWVLHTFYTMLVQSLSNFLWWIPFSHVVVYGFYLWIVASVDTTDHYYHLYIHKELHLLHHWLQGTASDEHDSEGSAWQSLWKTVDRYIPKAAAEDDSVPSMDE